MPQNLDSVVSGESTVAEAADPLHATALLYHNEFPWSDLDAIEGLLGVFRANRVIGAALGRYLESLGLGLSRARYTVLRTLYFASGKRMPQNEIGREMGVSRTNITNLVDGLEKDRLVVRMTNPSDRRVTYAQLTPEGEALCQSMMPAMTRFMEDVLSDLSADEKAVLRELMSRIWRTVESRYRGGECASDAEPRE